jgi:hypothetical protein
MSGVHPAIVGTLKRRSSALMAADGLKPPRKRLQKPWQTAAGLCERTVELVGDSGAGEDHLRARSAESFWACKGA